MFAVGQCTSGINQIIVADAACNTQVPDEEAGVLIFEKLTGSH